jgi:type IV fimbrial biogenesis protein FimT
VPQRLPRGNRSHVRDGSGPGGNGWVSGWIVFHDKNNNGDRNYNADAILDDTVLRVQSPITAMGLHRRVWRFVLYKLVFTGTGRLQSLTSATSIQFGGGAFANDLQRVVCVSLGGRARIAGDGTTSCGGNGL